MYAVSMMPIDTLGVVSIDPIVVSVAVLEIHVLDIRSFFKGEMVKIDFASVLAEMRLSDFHQNNR